MAPDKAGPSASEQLARQMRIDIIDQIFAAGSGHPGGSLSCVDLLACVFATRVDVRALLADDPDRNHFILSKGHAAPALYAALAGVGAIDRKDLAHLRQLGSPLQGHPDRTRLRAVEMSTGSLGQGLSVATGLAWAMRRAHLAHRVFAVLGDGELDEGQVWEAIALAGAQKLNNLVAIVDANGIQNDGRVEDVLDLRPYPDKFTAFSWRVKEIDGHDHREILASLDWAEASDQGPSLVLAHTTKGRGISFMEHRPEWHSHSLNNEQLSKAMQELSVP